MKSRNGGGSTNATQSHFVVEIRSLDASGWRTLCTFCLFSGKLSKENCVQCMFLRILFAVIKQRAMAYFAERHDALGFLGKKYSKPSKVTFTSVDFAYNGKSKTVASKHSFLRWYIACWIKINGLIEVKTCDIIVQTCDFRNRFREIANQKQGGKYYSDLRSFERFKKAWRNMLTTKMPVDQRK